MFNRNGIFVLKMPQSSIAPSGKLLRSDEMLVSIRRIRFSVVTDGGGSICFGFINLKERMGIEYRSDRGVDLNNYRLNRSLDRLSRMDDAAHYEATPHPL